MEIKTYDDIIEECIPEVFLLFVSSFSEIRIEHRVKFSSIFSSMIPCPKIMLVTKKDVVECDAPSLANELGSNRFDFSWKDFQSMLELYKNDIKDYNKLFAYYYLMPEQEEYLRKEGFDLINFNDDATLEEIIKYV